MPVSSSFVHGGRIDPSLLTWDRAVGYDSLKNKGLDPTAPIGGSAFGGGSMGSSGNFATGTKYNNVEQITQLINEINQAAQQKANAGRIPSETGLEQQSSANIGNALAGQVDPSTINLLGQQAAERGVSTGSPLGASNNAAYLRALGLTSMDRMNTGQNWLSQATARNPAAPVYGAQDRFLTAAQEQQAQLAREQMANNLRIAQMHYANQGSGGVRGFGHITDSQPVSSPAIGSNWIDRLIPQTPAAGWTFPRGYNNIPVGGLPVQDNNVTDQDITDMWLPPSGDFSASSGGQPDWTQPIDWSSMLPDYEG